MAHHAVPPGPLTSGVSPPRPAPHQPRQPPPRRPL